MNKLLSKLSIYKLKLNLIKETHDNLTSSWMKYIYLPDVDGTYCM